MRTNFAGLFLAVGMGLIVVLLGLGALSVAGLVSIAPLVAKETVAPADTTALPQAWCGNAYSAYVPANPTEAASIANGDALFKSNCTQCHAVNEKVVGPALVGITKRRSINWIVSWVHNPAKVIASGDEYGVKLFNDNDKQQMPSFPLSKKEIEDIMAWIESQEGGLVNANNTVAYAGVAIQ
ncbi:MAG: cytochrome c [Hymenobacter sp.]|nr:MAG: cytochrome c [Hymenobacter sp.]